MTTKKVANKLQVDNGNSEKKLKKKEKASETWKFMSKFEIQRENLIFLLQVKISFILKYLHVRRKVFRSFFYLLGQ